MSTMLLKDGKGVGVPEETQILAARLASLEAKLEVLTQKLIDAGVIK